MPHHAAAPARAARAQLTRSIVLAIVAAAIPATLPAALGAQQRGTIAGVVSVAESGQPVAGARVTVRGRRAPALSDSAGHYRLTEVPPGTLVLQVRAIGHADATRIVEVAPGASVSVDVALVGATQLGEVVVTGRQPELPTRFAEFEYRRKNGRGQYLAREEIEKANAMNVPNLLRNMRGVRLECSGITCSVRMARSTGVDCPPEYWVDGRPSPHFGPTMPVGDLQAVEVYTGPSEAPAEFLSGNAACGIIVLWTKSTP
jgi:hypothetical protein